MLVKSLYNFSISMFNIFSKKKHPYKTLDKVIDSWIVWLIWLDTTKKKGYFLNQIFHNNKKWIGTVVVDSTWELTDTIYAKMPKRDYDKYIVIDFSDHDKLVNCYNPVRIVSSRREIAKIVDRVTSVFIDHFWPAIFWPRVQDYFRFWLSVLISTSTDKSPRSITQLPRLFVDDVFMEVIMGSCTEDYILDRYKSYYKNIWKVQKHEMISYFTSKFTFLLNDARIRNILSCHNSVKDINKYIHDWKTVIINLALSDNWKLNTKFLWNLITNDIFNSNLNCEILLYELQYYSWSWIHDLNFKLSDFQRLVYSYETSSYNWNHASLIPASYINPLHTFTDSIVLVWAWVSDSSELFELMWWYDIEWMSIYQSYEMTLIDLPEENTKENKGKLKQIMILKYWRNKELLEKEIAYQLWY